MSPHQHIYDRVIGMMADLLCLAPQVDPADDAECEARWREQRIAEIAIQEFGPDAKAIVQARLAKVAEDAGRCLSPPAISASIHDGRDGRRVFGIATQEDRHVA